MSGFVFVCAVALPVFVLWLMLYVGLSQWLAILGCIVTGVLAFRAAKIL